MITVITPTCDQPTGIALAELFMARQSVQPDQWIVVDDGEVPARLTMDQLHVRRDREQGCTPAQSLCRNLLAAVPLVDGDAVVFWEHDDCYQPTHIETIVSQLTAPAILAAGDDQQRYYNVAHRCWRNFDNRGASLCQTAIRRDALPTFELVVKECLQREKFGVDFNFWMRIKPSARSLKRTNTVLGIKGLPGRPGIGIGHRPSGPQWHPDRDLSFLRSLIGDDASLYEAYFSATA